MISKFVNTSNESYYKVGQQRVKKFTGLSVQQDAPEQDSASGAAGSGAGSKASGQSKDADGKSGAGDSKSGAVENADSKSGAIEKSAAEKRAQHYHLRLCIESDELDAKSKLFCIAEERLKSSFSNTQPV